MENDEGKLLVFGNLLMDMVVTVEESYLKAYELEPDSTQTVQEKYLNIFDEISNMPGVTFSPGGSALNTVRMTQRLIGGRKNVITLVGAVGADEAGDFLSKTVEKEGIKMLAQVLNSPTGKCASLLTNGGSSRTMVTDLGASLKFSHEIFMATPTNFDLLEKAKFLYISGYFLKVSPNTVMEAVRHVKIRNVPVLLNLNAIWVTTLCKNELIKLLPFVDVLFGNESEVTSFAEQIGLAHKNILDIASQLSSEKDNSSNRIVLVTRGENPVVYADSGVIRELPVPVVPKNLIVDSTGAGDAFVGGFLSKFVDGCSIDACISCGILAATEELKGYGFILPEKLFSICY